MAEEVAQSEFPKTPRSASGSDIGWSIQVRFADHREPSMIGELMITNKWKTLDVAIDSIPDGIPIRRSHHGLLEQYRLLEYPTAQAVRWHLHAEFRATDLHRGRGLETRLVRHDLEYSSKATPVGAQDEAEGSY